MVEESMELHHVLIIPDGNRRYAKREYLVDQLSGESSLSNLSLPRNVTAQLEDRIGRFMQTKRDPLYDEDGMPDHLKHLDSDSAYLQRAYRKGAENIDAIVRYILADVDGLASTIKKISLYGLQPANLQRKSEEIEVMLQAEMMQADEWLQDKELLADVKFKIVGDLALVGKQYQEIVGKLDQASHGDRLRIFLLVPYSCQWEINQAIQEGEFDESRLIVPPVDLVIRTGGEKRISEAVPIQARNAEYVFRNEYFPDFTVPVFESCLEEFHQRARRFGK